MSRILLCAMAVAAIALLSGCATGIPDGVKAVDNFDAGRYLGTWHEIARLDHSFERGLSNVSATYSAREDGGIKVVNRGYDKAKGKWRQVEGRAYFIDGRDQGRLKVSFFRPFYGAYNIFALDKDGYGYALVCGPDRSYLWILARERSLDKATLDSLVAKARRLGFDTEALIYVSQDSVPEGK